MRGNLPSSLDLSRRFGGNGQTLQLSTTLFNKNPFILDASSVTLCRLLVSSINSIADTKLSLHIDSQIPESIPGNLLVAERNCLVEYRA
jgi:hypothetical protein